MATIKFTFTPKSMTTAQYDECMKRLRAVGADKPAGRLYHVCSGTGEKLQVVDVWDSEQAFGKFGETLMPILKAIGVDPGQPEIVPVHNIVKG